MSISSRSNQVTDRRFQRVGIKRTTLVVTLNVLLGLLGSITVAFAVDWHSGQLNIRTITHAMMNNVLSLPQNHGANLHPFPTPYYTALHSLSYPLQSGNASLPEIALTFDDGPNPYYTPQVLAILQKYRVNATFFCIGRQVATYPDLIKREYEAGNIVGNHTWSHANLKLLSASAILTQLNRTSDAIQAAIGVRPTLFRPPYGSYNSLVLAMARYLDVSTILWNDEAKDWLLPGIDAITNRILSTAHNGSIILLHDGGGYRFQTVAALPTIIETLQNRGFRFVTIEQMVADLQPAIPPARSVNSFIAPINTTPFLAWKRELWP